MQIISPNTLILYDKHSLQHYYSTEDELVSSFLHFEIDDEISETILANMIFNTPILINQADVIDRLMWLIFYEYHNIYANHNNNTSHLLGILIKKIEEELALSSVNKISEKFTNVVTIRNQILQNPHYDWNIKELAKQCNMSESYFQIVYKKLFETKCISDVIMQDLIWQRTCF